MFRNQYRFMGRYRMLRAPVDMGGMASFGGASESQPGGGGGGSGAQVDDAFAGEGGRQQGGLIGQEDDGEDTELKDMLSAFADPDSGDDDDDDGAQTPGAGAVSQEEIGGMQQLVTQTIAQMRMPDNLIPENFDANDPQQLNQLLTRTMQHTVSQSLNVVFKPVQLAMKQMAATLQGEIDTKIKSSTSGMKDSAVLESIVPEINDPQHSGLVKTLDESLKAKGKKVQERAKTIRKMLNQMGIQSNGAGNRRTSNPNGNSGGGVKTGHAALDEFFGAFPKPK